MGGVLSLAKVDRSGKVQLRLKYNQVKKGIESSLCLIDHMPPN